MRTPIENRSRLRTLILVLFTLAAIALTSGNPARAIPPPRSRAEIEAVLARSPGPPPLERQRPLRIVLVANEKDHGPNEHDYPLWQKRWAALLGGRAAGEGEVTRLYGESPEGSGSAADAAGLPGVTVTKAWGWPAKDVLDSADVVVAFIGTGGRWSRERIADLDALLARGGGFVAIHSAVIAGRELERSLADHIGLAWEDTKTTFRHGQLDLEVRALDHPICLGLPGKIHFEDETYWPLAGDLTGVDVLATADEPMPPGPGGSPAPQPMIWTREHGKGRSFSCLLGHYTWTFDDPYFRILVLRGIAWAARQSPFRFDPLVLRGARVRDDDATETTRAVRERKPVPPRPPDAKDARLVLWLDASDRSTLTLDSSGLVSDWSSRAGSGRAFSSSGAQRPRYVPDGVGGRSSVRFDGTDDILRDTGFRRSAVDWTLFIALGLRSNDGGFRCLFAANQTDRNVYVSGINLDLGGGSTSSFDVLNLEGIQHEGQSSLKEEPAAFGAHVVSVVRGAGRAVAFVDGIVEGERTSSDVAASLEEVRIGGRNYANPPGRLPLVESGFLDGDIAEVLLYGAALGDDERAGIEAHFLEKYGTAVVRIPEPTIEEAFAHLPSYDAAEGRRMLGPIDTAIAESHGSAEKIRVIEDRLISALDSSTTPDARDFICRRLGSIGTSKCVPHLAALLADERLSHQARVALERIGGPQAAAALRDAARKVEGRLRAGIIDSIGRLDDRTAVSLLTGFLGDRDAQVAAAAASALGRAGASETLRGFLATAAGEAREAALWALIDLGNRLLDEGKKESAAGNFRSVLDAAGQVRAARIAALRGFALAAPREARPLLEEAARSEDPRIRAAAERLREELGAGARQDGARP